MPWWAIAYLVVLVLIMSVSIIKNIKDRRAMSYTMGEIISGATGIGLVIACWNTELSNTLSWLVIPLVMYAIIWDRYALRHMKKPAYPDLSSKENDDMHKYSKLFAIALVLPSYLAGLYLSYHYLLPQNS